jgi:ABC-type transport system involved in multi-copper enzyme maturation permease subunit
MQPYHRRSLVWTKYLAYALKLHFLAFFSLLTSINLIALRSACKAKEHARTLVRLSWSIYSGGDDGSHLP